MVVPFSDKKEGKKTPESSTEDGHPLAVKMSLMKNIQGTFFYCTYYLMIWGDWFWKTVIMSRQGKKPCNEISRRL